MSNNSPKPVLLFQEDEKALGYQYELPRELSMRDIDVKSIDYDVEEVNKNYTLAGSRPTENSVYYLDPYDVAKKRHINEKNFTPMNVLKSKINYFLRVGDFLGATKMEVKVKSVNKAERKIDFDVNGNYKLVKAKVDVTNEEIKEIIETYEVYEKLSKKENFDLNRNIDILRSELKELNLFEPDLERYIDGRDARISGNSTDNRGIRTDLASEYNNILDISGKLSNPVFSVSAGFKDSLKIVNQIIVDIKFEF